MKIHYTHLLMKAHFFFFLGSVGPTVPFLQVYGKQLGISPSLIGSIDATFSILLLITRPTFGFLMDYFEAWRKCIYLSLFIVANSCFVMLFLLPPLPGVMPAKYHFHNMSCVALPHCDMESLPFESTSTTILKDVFTLLKSKSIIVSLCFVTFVGCLNSILSIFLFWYLEDLAIETGYMSNIKLIEGLIVAMQTFGSEILFFFISGKILQKLGYSYTIIFSLICYALRLGLITLAPTPWWVFGIEFLQGPSYALCYATIMLYANVVSPSGAAATVQGLVSGLLDGFGLSIGSLVGGFLYKTFGGIITLRIFSVLAALAALIYFILYTFYLKHKTTDTRSNVKWGKPDEAQEHCVTATDLNITLDSECCGKSMLRFEDPDSHL
ncbi:PREDICTED: uncharacterized protein LOC105562158 isoform X4 [Vollenhovia emeryi]|uniref:uncharacterized protein LOC105562158 isoform X4 n=1 Tax=Vollenhovia emeryi TaxID=411798 RepID=UPI0005F40AAC|nr:PREDICTED: uncharacterized protein LOC105562158 isoform X4 [Vollenhovia emeryi]